MDENILTFVSDVDEFWSKTYKKLYSLSSQKKFVNKFTQEQQRHLKIQFQVQTPEIRKINGLCLFIS